VNKDISSYVGSLGSAQFHFGHERRNTKVPESAVCGAPLLNLRARPE